MLNAATIQRDGFPRIHAMLGKRRGVNSIEEARREAPYGINIDASGSRKRVGRRNVVERAGDACRLGGIAYVRACEGWLCLVAVLDIRSHMVIRWPFSSRNLLL